MHKNKYSITENTVVYDECQIKEYSKFEKVKVLEFNEPQFK